MNENPSVDNTVLDLQNFGFIMYPTKAEFNNC